MRYNDEHILCDPSTLFSLLSSSYAFPETHFFYRIRLEKVLLRRDSKWRGSKERGKGVSEACGDRNLSFPASCVSWNVWLQLGSSHACNPIICTSSHFLWLISPSTHELTIGKIQPKRSDWAKRYTDILGHTWGRNVCTEASESCQIFDSKILNNLMIEIERFRPQTLYVFVTWMTWFEKRGGKW